MTRIPGNHVCGLYYVFGATLERVYLPQVRLDSHTIINPVCFTTKLTQTFQNSGDKSLSQVRYTFPLYDGVAVNGYTIRCGSKVLKGIVKQKDDAKETYQAAIDRGETAGLLESLPAGVFGVTLGNVPANTDVVVEITYCGELKHDAAIDGLRYMLPTSIAPRHGNYPGKVLDSNAVARSGISITVDIDMANSAIRKVQSPSHPIAVSMGATSSLGTSAPFNPSQGSATLTLGKTELAEDFVLQLFIDDINKPQAILENHPKLPNQRALMATLVPRFTLDPTYPEIVFIADQSGSMRGPKNTSLVSALKVFLKSLPLGVRFNICAFGNNFKFLWPKSQAYNENNLNTALSFVGTLNADYGGTEILKPVTAAFEQRLQDMPLEVMMLTDGEIWDEDAVFNYINEQIRDKSVDARVFALGIGGDVSHTLVEGVARAGNGFAQFVTQNENVDEKVLRMLKGALYAHTKDYELEVHYDEKDRDDMSNEDFEIIEKVNECLVINDNGESPASIASIPPKTTSFFDRKANVDAPLPSTDPGTANRYAHLPTVSTPKILQAPTTVSPFFPFNRSTIYLMFDSDSIQDKISSVTLRAKSAQGPLVLTMPVYETRTVTVPSIHQLAARKAVQDLEEGRGWLSAAKVADGAMVKTKHGSRFDEIVERECVRLGEKFQVAGKYSSFVAVENKDGEVKETKVSQEEDVGGLGGRRFGGVQLMSSADSGKKRKSAGFSRMAFANAAPMAAASSHGLGGSAGGLFRHRKVLTDSSNVEALADADDEDCSLEGVYDAAPYASQSFGASFACAPSGSAFGYAGAAPPPGPSGGLFGKARSAIARVSTGGATPRKQLASMAAKQSAPSLPNNRDNSKESSMRQLIDLQTFSGAWGWSHDLLSVLQISETTIEKMKNEMGLRSDVCATVLAIAWLETKATARKASWEMIVTKARGWLASQVPKDVDAIVKIAADYL